MHLNTELNSNKAMIAKPDKGNSIHILCIQDYDRQINNIITENYFLMINTDPTNSFQNTIRR